MNVRSCGAIVSAALLALHLASLPAAAAFYFGDLHAHSGLSDDATGSAEGFFLTARDVARLDFVALSDHDVFLTPNEWEILKSTAASFDRPGELVAFSAIEWTHHWHMNAVFERYDEEYCQDCGFPPDFYEFYGPRVEAGAAAAHVNHPADLYNVDWLQIDDTITTSVEVWNTGGAGDNEPGFGNALWALRAGFRLGLVGVSDDHSTDTDPILLGTGLTGCEAEALTRADLLEVLRARGCYATSGERIELRFSVDGAPMGSELERPIGSALPVVVEVKATETPVTIELLRDGDVVAHETCTTPLCELSTRIRVEEPNQFYYARIRQPGDELAWSSPVWIEGECTRPSGCLRSRLLRGGGAPEDDCLTEWLRAGRPLFEPRSSPGADLLCIDGDPSCDFGDTPGECTMRIGLCVGVEDPELADCEPGVPDALEVLSPAGGTDRDSPEYQNQQTLATLLHAIRPNEDGAACSPLSELRVPLGRLRVVTSASAGSRVDEDELVVECQPAPEHRHPHRHRLAHDLG